MNLRLLRTELDSVRQKVNNDLLCPQKIHFQKDLKGKRLEAYCDILEVCLLLHHLYDVSDYTIDGTKCKIRLKPKIVNHTLVQ